MMLGPSRRVAPVAATALRQKVFLRAFAAAAKEYDLCVIGAGPGGYVGAIKAAQLGLSVVCVEKRGKLGGTCLNVGCIPSKALLQSSHHFHMAKKDFANQGIMVGEVGLDLSKMMGAKDKTVDQLTAGIEYLFKKNKVDYVKGAGTLKGPNSVDVALNEGEGTQQIKAKNIMLATGSDIVSIPGVTIDEEQIISSTGALKLKEVPAKMVVIGGGVIGLELGSVWSRLGAEVTVVEFMDSIGGLGVDVQVGKEMLRLFKKQGLKFQLKTKVTGVEKSAGGLKITTEAAAGGEEKVLDANVCLVCVGRRQFLDKLGAEEVGVKMDGRKVKINDLYQTSVPSIYAIGDIVDGPMLAHKAEDEGVLVAEYLATGAKPHLDYNKVPSVVYTHPEVAWVGKTEEQLKTEGVAYKKGNFSFAANSRAKAAGDTDGFVKVLADEKTDKLLGVHIINAAAGELISEACLAIEYGATTEDIARVCHAHPTLSEALKGAAQVTAFGAAINA